MRYICPSQADEDTADSLMLVMALPGQCQAHFIAGCCGNTNRFSAAHSNRRLPCACHQGRNNTFACVERFSAARINA